MENEKKLLADKLVKKFIDNYYNLIGTKPLVKYSINESVFTLNEIYNVVNEAFRIKMQQDDVSIDENFRGRLYIQYRNLYYSMAIDNRHSLTSISKLVNRDRATIYHGIKSLSKNSELKKQLMIKLQSTISEKI